MDNYKSIWDHIHDHLGHDSHFNKINDTTANYRNHTLKQMSHEGKEVIRVSHNGQHKFFGQLRPVMHTLDMHYARPSIIQRIKKSSGVSYDSDSTARHDPRVNSIAARYGESEEPKSFKDLLYEMPQLNDITKNTPGYSIHDSDDARYSSDLFKRKFMSVMPSGHRLYHISNKHTDDHYFAAYHPTENKPQTMMQVRKTNNTTFMESGLKKREGSTAHVDDMVDHLVNHHGYTIYSDISHSPAAKRVWTRIRDKVRKSGAKMHHIDVTGHETFAGKPMDAYYGDTPSNFKVTPSPNVIERLKRRTSGPRRT